MLSQIFTELFRNQLCAVSPPFGCQTVVVQTDQNCMETKSDFVLIPLTGSWVASCNICDNTESGQAPQAAVASSGCSLRRKSSTFESPMVHASNNNQRGMPNLIGKWMMSEQSKTWHVRVAHTNKIIIIIIIIIIWGLTSCDHSWVSGKLYRDVFWPWLDKLAPRPLTWPPPRSL